MDVTTWLAEATGDDAEHVAAELELGERRRAFVYEELTEAGFTGPLLVDFMMRLTGLDERQARALIVARQLEDAPAQIEVPQRDTRLAQNEIVFRQLNEQIAHLGPREPPDSIELVCECSDHGCTKRLTMPFAEYEWLRQNPWRFVVLPGHEAPAIEDVVELHASHAIVEKHGETHQQVENADPRSEDSRLRAVRSSRTAAADA